MRRKFFLFILAILVASSCNISKKVSLSVNIDSLKFLDEYIIPFNYSFNNTTVGGLSGIDFDSKEEIYYLICDDRSDKNPARFYTAKINLKGNIVDSIYFVSVHTLKDKVGKNYPNSRQNAFKTPDPEAMRYNSKTKNLVWSSEGERIITDKEAILLNPSITEIDKKGNFLDTFILPSNYFMQPTENGPRRNGVFEGLAFSSDYKTLFVSTEEPLYEDGPRAGLNDSSGIIRIIQYNVKTKKPIAQYAYKIDPVAFPPDPGGFKVNGISDIMWLNKQEILVIERSFSVGRDTNTIKVFIANLSGADNIRDIQSLNNQSVIKFASKKLLLNMDSLNRFIDNIEGVTYGPRLPNGKKSLIFVADNNFNSSQKTQFLLFEVN